MCLTLQLTRESHLTYMILVDPSPLLLLVISPELEWICQRRRLRNRQHQVSSLNCPYHHRNSAHLLYTSLHLDADILSNFELSLW